MNREQVETVEEFKLRIAAIIRAEAEDIPDPPKPRAKRPTARKGKRVKAHKR